MPYQRIFRILMPLLISISSLTAEIISGQVIDAASGAPVINANIMVKGTNLGTASDLNGNFIIDIGKNSTYRLFVSHIAYQDQVFPVTGNNSTDLIIELKETFFQLSEVVVTGTRTEKIHQNVPVTTEVISKKDIDDSGTLDLGELLNQRAGVATTSSVEGGQVVNLMGIDSRYILILIDGQPVTGKFNNRVSLEQIPTSIIEKIEIIKGPNSSLYGSEAMGGVINVITAKAAAGLDFSIRGRYSADFAHYEIVEGQKMVDSLLMDSTVTIFRGPNEGPQYNLQTTANYGGKSLSNRLNLDFTFAIPNDIAPHINVDQIQRFSLGNDFNWALSERSNFHLKYELFMSGEESRTSAMNATTSVRRNNIVGDANYNFTDNLELQLVTRWADYLRQYDQIRPWNESAGIYESRDTTAADDLEVEAIGIYTNDNITVNVGAEQGLTSYTGERLKGGTRELSSSSYYGQVEFSPLDKITLILGSRRDDNDEIAPVNSPRLAIMYTMDERWKWRAAYGRGFRQPSFMERYIDWYHAGIGYSIIGNPDLKPERSVGGNLGVEYYHPGAYQVSLMVYYTNFYDMIDDYIYDGPDQSYPGTAFSYRNINKVRFTGIELQNRWKISSQWLASWGYNFVDNRNIETGELISNTQPHTGNLRMSYQGQQGKFSASLKAKIVGPYYPEEFNTEVDDFVRATEKRNTFAIVDFDVSLAVLPSVKISMGSQNIRNYTDDKYGPYIGRRIYAEISLNN